MNDDAISRQAVLKLLAAMPPEEATTKAMLTQGVKQMDAAPPYTDEEIQKMQDIEQAQLEKAYEIGKADALQWIPCGERLPEMYYNYLITTGEGDTDIGTFSPESNRWYICDADGFKRAEYVLAWMPLPEPYKEKNNEPIR